jgi:uncharacterized protein (TIGR03437 family)
VDNTGFVTSDLGGTQVFFDGAPAPLLYASSGLLNAAVPFSVASPSTQVAVQYDGQSSVAETVPVVPATPALFTEGWLGTRQVAVLNEDGSVNSATNPAEAGSMVSLFETGLGPTNPAGQDGAVVGEVLPTAALPVTVLIGDLPAYVVYEGGAPTMVEGVFQINVRVPPLSSSGSMVSVELQVEDALSPSNTWLAIK